MTGLKLYKNQTSSVAFRLLGMEAGASGRACSNGRHINGNGRNLSCVQHDCHTNATLCKKHEKLNKEKPRTYRNALRWKQQVTRGQNQNEQEDFIFLITVPEKNKADSTNLLDDMDSVRERIHMKYSSGSHELNDIISYFPDTHQEEMSR